MFDKDEYLKYIEISKKDWYVHELKMEEKIGRDNNYEYEYSVLDYLNKFLMSQIEGQIEWGRELWFGSNINERILNFDFHHSAPF